MRSEGLLRPSRALALGLLLMASAAWANMSGEEEAQSNDPNVIEGKKALDNKDTKKAIELFEKAAASDPKDANVQNYLGFAHRSSGNLDLAIKYYQEALRLSPGHKGAHEYIGEAYLLAGNPGKAEEHLQKLDQICMLGCEEFKQLKAKIAEYKKAKAKPK
jgi:Flp pilus assembly protein TadD